MRTSKVTRSIELTWVLAATVACALAACVDAAPLPIAEAPPAPAYGPPVEFVYETTDGGHLAAADLRGRLTVIAFIATYDLDSQGLVKILGFVQRSHTPRVNVAAIALEQPDNKPLVIAFAESLDLRFPVALADERTIAGRGPFDKLHSVPSVVILDREGREAYRHIGGLGEKAIHAALDQIDLPRPSAPRK
jgi:hypothetical protein